MEKGVRVVAVNDPFIDPEYMVNGGKKGRREGERGESRDRERRRGRGEGEGDTCSIQNTHSGL